MNLPADFTKRFWEHDGSLWSNGKYGATVTDFLGWTNVAETMLGRVDELSTFVADVRAAGFERVVVAGMGGSSLAPLVLSKVFSNPGGLPLAVLDSTDPETILAIEKLGPVEKALFVISSKSGGTAEPNAFNDYFYAKVKNVRGDAAGKNFVAITDPGSPFQARSTELGFRKIFLNFADIGGRYSALSYFGLVPVALMGIDVAKLLDRAIAVCQANGPGVAVDDAPAVTLGRQLGDWSLIGRNKLTFVMPDHLSTLGLWLEQLIAESTGKEGKGILPIASERLGGLDVYGADRVFAYTSDAHHPSPVESEGVASLRGAGHPVVEAVLNDPYDLGGQFMHWEIATAVAGAVIGINPFDQPNVQESKDITKRVIHELEASGKLPDQKASVTEGDEAAFGGDGNTIANSLLNFINKTEPGDFICLQAYLSETEGVSEVLATLQATIRDARKVPCTCGYGPRFLHSTGQFHKGGPNTGHFIQFTQDHEEDAAVPGKSYSFGSFITAQAIGDGEALRAHDRRVLRVHLGHKPLAAIERLVRAVTGA